MVALPYALRSRGLAEFGPQVGALDEDRRPPDSEERSAWHRLRQHRIPRSEYERIVVRRKFVHGDVSEVEHDQVMREIGEQGPPPPKPR